MISRGFADVPVWSYALGLVTVGLLLTAPVSYRLAGAGWTRRSPRPALLLWQAARRSDETAAGAAVGLLGHLGRDLATGKTRVALFWPLTRRPFSIRWRTYAAGLAALAGLGALRAGAGGGGESALTLANPSPPSHPATTTTDERSTR